MLELPGDARQRTNDEAVGEDGGDRRHRQGQQGQRRQQIAGIPLNRGQEVAGGHDGRNDPAAEIQGGEGRVVGLAVIRAHNLELTGVADRPQIHLLAVDHVLRKRQQPLVAGELIT